MLINDGIISEQELKEVLPPGKRYEKGPVAIIECLQDIPCDPCVTACHVKAISMAEGITDKPHIDFDKCTGCGLCVPSCPGLAIFVIDMNYTKDTALVSMSYEMLNPPAKNDLVSGLDRAGKVVCEAKAVRVLSPKKFDKTAVVTVEVPRELAMTVRAVKVIDGGKK